MDDTSYFELLPIEVQTSILRLVPTRNILSLVCKKWYQIAKQFYYGKPNDDATDYIIHGKCLTTWLLDNHSIGHNALRQAALQVCSLAAFQDLWSAGLIQFECSVYDNYDNVINCDNDYIAIGYNACPELLVYYQAKIKELTDKNQVCPAESCNISKNIYERLLEGLCSSVNDPMPLLNYIQSYTNFDMGQRKNEIEISYMLKNYNSDCTMAFIRKHYYIANCWLWNAVLKHGNDSFVSTFFDYCANFDNHSGEICDRKLMKLIESLNRNRGTSSPNDSYYSLYKHYHFVMRPDLPPCYMFGIFLGGRRYDIASKFLVSYITGLRHSFLLKVMHQNNAYEFLETYLQRFMSHTYRERPASHIMRRNRDMLMELLLNSGMKESLLCLLSEKNLLDTTHILQFLFKRGDMLHLDMFAERQQTILYFAQYLKCFFTGKIYQTFDVLESVLNPPEFPLRFYKEALTVVHRLCVAALREISFEKYELRTICASSQMWCYMESKKLHALSDLLLAKLFQCADMRINDVATLYVTTSGIDRHKKTMLTFLRNF